MGWLRTVEDDAARLRNARVGTDPPGGVGPVGGSPGFVGRVTTPTAKIAVGHFVLVTPDSVLGAEVEGSAGLVAPVGSTSVPVYILGPAAPAQGDDLVCRFVDHRWVAERSTTAGAKVPTITLRDCFCPVPARLKMTSADPACNYGMFQSGTISYQATPAWATPLGLGPMIFLGDRSYFDRITGASFYYYLYCQYNQYNLTRLYPTSPYGSPYRDALLYSWVLGGYGNTCSPFALDGGQPFPGSDQSCAVQLDPL